MSDSWCRAAQLQLRVNADLVIWVWPRCECKAPKKVARATKLKHYTERKTTLGEQTGGFIYRCRIVMLTTRSSAAVSRVCTCALSAGGIPSFLFRGCSVAFDLSDSRSHSFCSSISPRLQQVCEHRNKQKPISNAGARRTLFKRLPLCFSSFFVFSEPGAVWGELKSRAAVTAPSSPVGTCRTAAMNQTKLIHNLCRHMYVPGTARCIPSAPGLKALRRRLIFSDGGIKGGVGLYFAQIVWEVSKSLRSLSFIKFQSRLEMFLWNVID